MGVRTIRRHVHAVTDSFVRSFSRVVEPPRECCARVRARGPTTSFGPLRVLDRSTADRIVLWSRSFGLFRMTSVEPTFLSIDLARCLKCLLLRMCHVDIESFSQLFMKTTVWYLIYNFNLYLSDSKGPQYRGDRKSVV